VTDEPVYAQFGFDDAEWGLLVGLPQSVLTAASAAESDGTRGTMAESAAGMDTISAGRESASPLVAAVAGELVSRVGDPERGEELPAVELADPRAYAADVLARTHTATLLLADRVGDGDAGAYRHWLVRIAEQVVTASSTGGVFGLGGDLVTEPERRFRDELAQILTD